MIRFFLIFALIFLFYSCSKKNEQIITKVQGDSLEEQMIEAYTTGVAALEKGDVLLMSILHPTLNHVAIFLGDMVLHHLADRLSCREPYSEWLLKCTGKRYRYAQKS